MRSVWISNIEDCDSSTLLSNEFFFLLDDYFSHKFVIILFDTDLIYHNSINMQYL